MATLNGRGVLFAIAHDVKIATPPEVIDEIVSEFPEIAWREAGISTQVVKKRIYVQPFARAGWKEHMEATPVCRRR
jgi:hypothetical protein